MNLFPNSRWRHFKGGYYRVSDVALDVERGVDVVIYHSEDTGVLYVRSLNAWHEEVVTMNGTVPRFTFVGD